jgi:hypothetical protein
LASGGRREWWDGQSKLQMDQWPMKQVLERAELPQDPPAAAVAPYPLPLRWRSAVGTDLELPRTEPFTPRLACNTIRVSLVEGVFGAIRRFQGSSHQGDQVSCRSSKKIVDLRQPRSHGCLMPFTHKFFRTKRPFLRSGPESADIGHCRKSSAISCGPVSIPTWPRRQPM